MYSIKMMHRVIILMLFGLFVQAAVVVEDEKHGCATPNRLALKTKENGLLIISDNDQSQECGTDNTNLDVKSIAQVSECCFDWLDDSPVTQRAINVTISNENFLLDKDLIDQVLTNSSYKEFIRHDKLPFYASFDAEVDQYNLRRENKNYNLSKRFEMITGQWMNMDAPLRPFQGAVFNSSQSFGGGQASKLFDNNSDATWIYGGGKGLRIHTRFSFGDTKIHVFKGSIALIVTPASDVQSLRTFPSTHALHDQTQIDFVQKRNYKVPASIFYVKAGQMVSIPVFTGFRFIVLEDDTIWSVSDYFKASPIIKAKHRAIKLIPRYLQPNALSGQPLFFGMWSLAIYADGLFGFMENRTEQRTKSTGLRTLVESRWGSSSVRLGHADDSRDFGLEAEEVMESIELECEEMAQTAKDLMLSERNKVEEEILRAAVLTRNELLKAVESCADEEFI